MEKRISGHDFTPQQGRERQLSITITAKAGGDEALWPSGFNALVKTAQLIELLTGAGIAAATELIGVRTEKVMAIR
ncbi:MAG: hypothetical protein K2X60_01655 [Xanthobacteraceae bacterium]|nr:hypothetical protein [Xanthobacteraceae bacterium]